MQRTGVFFKNPEVEGDSVNSGAQIMQLSGVG